MFKKILAVLAIIGMTVAPQAGAADAVTLQSGLLVDVVNGRAYFMQPAGGIAQIDVAAGLTGWVANSADRPLMLANGQLLAQVNSNITGTLNLQTLDAASGAALIASSVNLPRTVNPLIDDGLGSKFELRWTKSQQPTLLWRHEKRLIQGAAIADAPAPVKHAGRLAIEGNSLKALPNASKVALDDLWLDSSTNTSFAPDGVVGRQFLSTDASHVMATTLIQNKGATKYRWQITDIDGNNLGHINSRMSYAPFVVVGTVLVYVTQPFSERQDDGEFYRQGLSLLGVDINSGKTIWQREIRDTRYTGPFPT